MLRVNYNKFLSEGLNLAQDIVSIFFPTRCAVCGNPISGHDLLCFSCSTKIKPIKKPYCMHCGYPLYCEANNNFFDNFICGDCKIHKKWFDSASAAIQYNEQARALIHKYKFQGFTHFSYLLGKWTLQKYLYDERLGGEQMIIPVPLHKSRLRERGFNQAELIAGYISRFTSIPSAPETLKRIKKTKPQYEMTLEERQKNLKGAFKVPDSVNIQNKIVLVIDDIFTTGSTAYEVSRTLKKAGAKTVNFLTTCRALPMI